jgi:hypothetical protein
LSGGKAIARLNGLLQTHWLPNFVAMHPGAAAAAFTMPPLSEGEAAGFLRALDAGVLEMVKGEDGQETGLSRLIGYRAYYCYPVLFRPVKTEPGVQLWREWLTHASTAARLHLDFGYPRQVLAIEEDSFDIVVHGRHNEPFIAVEVKKSDVELEGMLTRLLELSRTRFDPSCGEKLGNADKKYRGLLAMQPAIFYAVSPGKEAVFDVSYSHDPATALFLHRESLPMFADT